MLQFIFTELAKAHMQSRGLMADDMLGTIPDMLSAADPDDSVHQIDRGYSEAGGGWRDTDGFRLDAERGTLTYPGDAPRRLIAEARLRDERILFFDGAWLAVVQPDGTFRVARID